MSLLLQRRTFLAAGLLALPHFAQTLSVSSAAATEHNATIDVDKLAIVIGGSGEPAVFVHGFGSSKFTWRHVCDGLKDIYSFYAIDLPGSGDSPAPEAFGYTLHDFADIIATFIVRKNLRNVTLVGASLGGGAILLSLLTNAALKSRVRAISLVGGIAYPQALPFFVGLLRVPLLGELATSLFTARAQAESVLKYCYFDRRLITAGQIDEYARYFARSEVRQALIKTARSIDAENLSEYVARLNTIQVPSLLIWGREDRVVPLRIGQRLARELPKSRLVVIDRCGHMAQEECTGEVTNALRAFARAAI
jgi:pimeloyl-ACP methyl ester carboxylesterase